MKSVTARELKNRTGAVLRMVRAGATVFVTNRGRRVAVIMPAAGAESDKQEVADRSPEAWANIEKALETSEPEYSDFREAMRVARGRP